MTFTLRLKNAAVPEWFAAAAFGLVTVFTLLLRNVPALQSNLLYESFPLCIDRFSLGPITLTLLVLSSVKRLNFSVIKFFHFFECKFAASIVQILFPVSSRGSFIYSGRSLLLLLDLFTYYSHLNF